MYRIYVVMDEPMEAQYKDQSLVHLEQKRDPQQDDNKIDATCDLELFLRCFDTSIYKMSDIEVLKVYFIWKMWLLFFDTLISANIKFEV